MLTGDIGQPGRARPRRPARRCRAGPVPPAQVHARLAGRGRRRDHGTPRARRSGSRTSTTASAPSSTSEGRGRPALLARPPRRQRPVPRGRRRPREACRGTGSSTARSWAGGTAPSCRSSPSRPGSGASRRREAIRAEVPVIFVAFDALGARAPAAAAAGRAAAARAARRAPPPARRPRPAAGRGRRPVRPLAPLVAADADAPRGRVHRRPRPAQRGPDGQGPDERLLARAGAASAG